MFLNVIDQKNRMIEYVARHWSSKDFRIQEKKEKKEKKEMKRGISFDLLSEKKK